MLRIVALAMTALMMISGAALAEGALGDMLILGAGTVVTGTSSLVCTTVNGVHIVRDRSSRGWGIAGIVSGAALLGFGMAAIEVGENEAGEDNLYRALVATMSVVTILTGAMNMAGAGDREREAREGNLSLGAALIPDDTGCPRPGLVLSWRF